jgi:serine/threonine protein phosphatase 1
VNNSTIYAIGDVHGCSDLLARLVDFIGNYAERNRRIPLVFFLGDIVDRGHYPLGAMSIVQDCIQRWPGSRLFRGNHEQMFLEVLDNPSDEHLKNRFICNGGYNTLRSFIGYDDPHTAEEIVDVAVRHAHHVNLMRRASLIEIVGRYAFVHAGIDPHVAIGEQSEKDMMWIREKFLDYVGPLSHIIVHGHTMLEPTRPVVTENRISLDTGAYHSGVLSMAVIDPETDAVEFYATNYDGSVQALEPLRLDRGYGDALTVHTPREECRLSEKSAYQSPSAAA